MSNNVKLPLHKFGTPGEARNGQEDGQASHTIFTLLKSWPEFSLLEAQLKTGALTRSACTCRTSVFRLPETTSMVISQETRN